MQHKRANKSAARRDDIRNESPDQRRGIVERLRDSAKRLIGTFYGQHVTQTTNRNVPTSCDTTGETVHRSARYSLPLIVIPKSNHHLFRSTAVSARGDTTSTSNPVNLSNSAGSLLSSQSQESNSSAECDTSPLVRYHEGVILHHLSLVDKAGLGYSTKVHSRPTRHTYPSSMKAF